ncbi:MAG TPA: hypothetical protein VFZ55_02985 [Nitrososphaera sp.]
MVTIKSTTQVTNVSRPVTVAIHIERSRGEEEQADSGQLQQQQQPLVPVEGAGRLTEAVKDSLEVPSVCD